MEICSWRNSRILCLFASIGGIAYAIYALVDWDSAKAKVEGSLGDLFAPEDTNVTVIDYEWEGCNGLESNCELKVNEILFATMHNAMSTAEDSFVYPNHQFKMEKALAAGYRGFLLDVCDCGDAVNMNLQFCHSVCFSGKKSPSKLFEYLVKFLTSNRGEVIILEFQMNSNPNRFPDVIINGLYDLMKNVDGFADMIYIHPVDSGASQWPTMGELVDTNKRLILFQHNGPDCSIEGSCPKAIHNFHDHVMETTFEFDSASDLMDYSKSCSIKFGNGGSKAFLNLNHFVTDFVPQKDDSRIVNTKEILEDRLQQCSDLLEGRAVNMMSVDFWAIGDLESVTEAYNTAQSLN
eukprot:CAMPEP_0194364172 /NCGR_PEP_ID=MMETSP0174-20130528/12086_1 /TAXON_ID=216777 /ORGANISM="Proboscia alata, Strain PI-D3" /LENGTH=349 /DNA_ID=CAMNT_0039138065 /DNA_START=92 /DNA_END=1141 /DNA_ORIENTATION=-